MANQFTASVPSDEAVIDAFEKEGSQVKAARVLGCDRSYVRKVLARNERLKEEAPFAEDAVIVEELPPADLPFGERLATMKQRNALRIAHARAQAWQTVKVPVEGPYGICWFGDPHLDDPFCDLDGFERDARICATTEGMYGANGGDSINNWVGKLERLYGEQSATVSEGWELVEWALKDLGVNWLIWLLGNHDTWNYGKRIFEGLNTNRVLMRDWDAKLKIVSPCGGVTTAWARHNFKGSSIYNELHGLKRAAMMDEQADIYAAFHVHTFATGDVELPGGRRACMIRARGYKDSDDYALKGQFTEQRDGQSVVTIITPRLGMAPKVKAFDDVAEAAEYLTFKRKRLGL
jgi:hypothetical protein